MTIFIFIELSILKGEERSRIMQVMTRAPSLSRVLWEFIHTLIPLTTSHQAPTRHWHAIVNKRGTVMGFHNTHFLPPLSLPRWSTSPTSFTWFITTIIITQCHNPD